MAGLRVSNERVRNGTISYQFATGSPSSRDYQYKGVLTPYVGTLFTVNSTWSLYASYADIFSNTSGLVRSDQSLLGPSHGVTMEAGLKGTWRDGTLNGSVALYKTVQRGLSVFDTSVRPRGNCCWTSDGRNESEGADVELTGHLAPKWLIGAGYSFNQSKQVVPGPEAPLWRFIPHHLLRVLMDYGLPGDWHRWTIGGTLHAQSAISGSVLRTWQKCYAVVSPRKSYQLNEHSQVALSIDNVFDRRYYESLSRVPGSNWYGEPRNFLIRLDARF
jgi:outer membrane receptor for ferric coprogen and ferric-rhodotorulic acid